MFWALEPVRNRETREPLVPYNAAGAANAPMAAFGSAAKAGGPWPFVNMNRTHVVPPCNAGEAELKEGLAALDAALAVADEYTEQAGTAKGPFDAAPSDQEHRGRRRNVARNPNA